LFKSATCFNVNGHNQADLKKENKYTDMFRI